MYENVWCGGVVGVVVYGRAGWYSIPHQAYRGSPSGARTTNITIQQQTITYCCCVAYPCGAGECTRAERGQ